MLESDAAALLGVTARTVRNYRRRGKLSYREIQENSQTRIDYPEEALLKLKAELDDRRTGRVAKRRDSKVSPRIAFVLPPDEFAELSTAAAKIGMHPSEYARMLMRESLESRMTTEMKDLRRFQERTETDLKRFRAEVSGAVEAILEFVGMAAPEAKEWVTENLR
jgi:hypothetical protein